MLNSLMYDPWRRFARMLDDGGGGAGGAAGGSSGGDEGGDKGKGSDEGGNEQPPKTYNEAYVKKLRDEAAANRVKAKEAESKLAILPQETTAKILKALGLEPDPSKNYEQQLADANKKTQEVEAKANERLIKAEVKSIAVELNLVDPDAAYALMDKAAVKVNDEGNVEGVKEALEALAKAKPYLVQTAGAGQQVGGSTNPPGGGGNAATTYTKEQLKKMSPDEINTNWEAIMKQLASGGIK